MSLFCVCLFVGHLSDISVYIFLFFLENYYTKYVIFNLFFQLISSFAKIVFLYNHTFLYSHHVISHFLKLHIRKPLIFRLSYHTSYLKMYNLDKKFQKSYCK